MPIGAGLAAKEYQGKLTIYKVNVDQERGLANTFQVRSIPTMLFFPLNGQPMMQVGAMQEQELRRIVEEHLVK